MNCAHCEKCGGAADGPDCAVQADTTHFENPRTIHTKIVLVANTKYIVKDEV
jgi:hypothetical protein